MGGTLLIRNRIIKLYWYERGVAPLSMMYAVPTLVHVLLRLANQSKRTV